MKYLSFLVFVKHQIDLHNLKLLPFVLLPVSVPAFCDYHVILVPWILFLDFTLANLVFGYTNPPTDHHHVWEAIAAMMMILFSSTDDTNITLQSNERPSSKVQS